MTLEHRIAEMVQAWRDAGQHEHADALMAQMREILEPFLRGGV